MRARLAAPAAIVGIAATVALALAAPAGAASGSAGGSLYSGPGPRPGPDILYRKPASSPQLANAGVWRARPTLISGTSAYRDGEFLYQDFLYDDHGARGERDPDDPRRAGTDSFALPYGTYTYPSADGYANNAADVVELRVRPLGRATAFRISLNTMNDPGLAATTIAIGDSEQPRELPHGANATAPAELFLTVHGRSADLVDAASGDAVEPAPQARVSRRRRQIEVRVPNAAWDPGRSQVRLAAGVGLWDVEAGRYLVPGDAASTSSPGGAGGIDEPTALFNVAFRHAEPFPEPSEQALTDPAWWRDNLQGRELREGNLGAFSATVDFAKLERGVSDPMRSEPYGVPRTGPMDRILVSRFETKQGADFSSCGSADECKGQLRGRLQPYSIYVPEQPRPQRGYGLTLLLHSLAASYNQFHGTRNQSQLGERGGGSIVITPSGRGVDGWYYDHAEADTFEVWADVARRYELDPELTAIAGYSMGGYGTYKLATRYPDLFAAANPVVGPPALGIWLPPAPPSGGESTLTQRMLGSVRNVPFLIWVAVADELVPYASVVEQADEFDRLGLRYRFDSFSGEHLTLAAHDSYQPAADFLGDRRVDRDPAHVTYVLNPAMDVPKIGVEADGAYWLSGMKLRDDSGDAPLGTADVRSLGFGVGDPEPSPTQSGGGTLEGDRGTLAYTSRFRTWGEAPAEPRRDRLEIEAENVATLTIHPRRAEVGCDATLGVETDGPLTVRLAGCDRRERFRP